VVKYLDVSSLKSVREFADEINKTESQLHVLIHNAGYASPEKTNQSVDGIELTMATNHYGPFLLTHLLIDLLKKSGPSRIVMVSSMAHILNGVDLNNLNPLNVWPGHLYYVSKSANVMFTLELARRLKGTSVTANVVHPGLVDSDIWRHIKQPLLTIINIVNHFSKTCEEGCQSSVYCAVAPELEKVSGQYFVEFYKFWLSSSVKDPKRLKEFWEGSMKLCGMKASDPKI
jgi:NAD(P)-dependent dehydrogenase (short-subunit alcohol dehydrogenase family)